MAITKLRFSEEMPEKHRTGSSSTPSNIISLIAARSFLRVQLADMRQTATSGAGWRNGSPNMKTSVETVFVGKDRLYNRRFQQMCSHYLIEPVGRTA
jgi:hypothetical protein